jgi:dephospho-CoA kinase
MTKDRPFVLCLTGSLGMGKSRTASFFAEAGVPVHDSDAAVHALYAGEAAIVHPLVGKVRDKFLADAQARGAPVVVLDVPLLYETGGQRGCDAVVVVSAPPEVQRRRALERPGMTEEKFAALLAKQMPDAEKRRRADFIVDSSQSFDHARAQVRDILQAVARMRGRAGDS